MGNFYSPFHWLAEENVIVLYIDHVREENDVPLRQRAVCIFDVYEAHRGQKLLDVLDINGFPNNLFKSYLKAEFQSFYADEIHKQLAAGKTLSHIKNIRSSVIKPLHAQWLVNSVSKLATKSDIACKSFSKAGLRSNDYLSVNDSCLQFCIHHVVYIMLHK